MSDLLREAFRQYCTTGKRKQVQDDVASLLEIIADAKANPLSDAELAAEDKRLMKVGAAHAKKVGGKERDVVRVVRQSRARGFAS